VSKTPARRVGHPEEFAGIAVFLASSAADFLTGQVLAFDGGVTLPSLNMQRPIE
jgi:NAD(P)-dependent dehydrogenase (short-subunit alcohol dehydrogenase family)